MVVLQAVIVVLDLLLVTGTHASNHYLKCEAENVINRFILVPAAKLVNKYVGICRDRESLLAIGRRKKC